MLNHLACFGLFTWWALTVPSGFSWILVLHNTYEDSLLAAPIILDLVLLAELSTRIQLKAEGEVRAPQ